MEGLQEEDEEVVVVVVVIVVRARKRLPKSKKIVHSSDGKLWDLEVMAVKAMKSLSQEK